MSGYYLKSHVVLVQPQQFGLLEGFASGLVSLANYVDAHVPNAAVRLLDLSNVPNSELLAEIRAATPATGRLFVGITTTTASYQSALRIAEVFRQEAPGECIVVLGGHHAGPQDTLILERHPQLVDVVVRGEGEIPLVQLLRNYPVLDFVPGITYRDPSGRMRRNAEPPLLQQEGLDVIPVTYRGEGLRSTPGKFDHATYVSARGCPLRCAFCAVANQTIRAKSVPAVIADLKYLVEYRGFRRIAIEDNFFAQSPRRTLELCRAIADYRVQSGVPFTWDCQTRVESMRSREVLAAMEHAGCEAVYLGVESLVEEHLSYLAKTANPNHYLHVLMEQVVPGIVNSRVSCYINLQLGIPGEIDAHRRLTMSRLHQLGSIALRARKEITVFPMLHVVYPGTSHFRTMVESGLLPEDCFETFTAWEVREEPIRTWLGEHFAHGTGGIPVSILEPEKLRRGEYAVNTRAVFRLSSYLTRMSRASGIDVFSYGRYLVQPTGEPITEGVEALV